MRDRRALIAGAGALAAAGAAGLWASQAPDRTPLGAPPRGWYIVSRPGRGDRERQLVASDGDALRPQEREIAAGVDIAYLAVAASPDGRYLALLKRVPHGSMPTDAVAVHERRTFRRLSETEVQIPFQRVPTFAIGWSADSARLAVPYDDGGRTLVFGVSGGQVALQAMIEHAGLRFHPTRRDIALYGPPPAHPGGTGIIQLASGAREQMLEQIDGVDAQWSPDGTKLAYIAGGPPRLVVRDEATRAPLATLRTRVVDMAWAPDSRRLAVYCLATNDPLDLGRLMPDDLAEMLRLGEAEPRLLVYDTLERRSVTIGGEGIPPGFEIDRLQWLSGDWLLVVGARASASFMIDRRGERRQPVPALDDYTPLLTWLPEA